MSVDLAVTEMGAGPPVIVLHGLFGSAGNWRSIGRALADRYRVLLVDLRNHGASGWADEMGYPAMATDVRAVIETRGLGAATIVGHSMGGKVAMNLALTAPGTVQRLAVVDIAPVVNPPAHLPYIRAMRRIDAARLGRRNEADELLRGEVPDPAVRAFLLQNLVPGENGGLRWRINLAAIEREMPAISDAPEPEGASAFAGPTLFIAGGNSDYIRPQHWPRIVALFPNAKLVTIADAGHWVHAERPEAFLAALTGFLDEVPVSK